jgi:AraC-like DNA-binding protein
MLFRRAYRKCFFPPGNFRHIFYDRYPLKFNESFLSIPVHIGMKSTVFNIHDIVLLLVIIECLMLAALFLARRDSKSLSHYLLAVFLLLNALAALDTLIFWGDEVRYRVFDISPNLFFLFASAIFLQGPALFWCVRSLTRKDFIFRPVETLHLLPATAVPVYLYIVYYRHPLEVKRDLILDFHILGAEDAYFTMFLTVQKVFVIVYGVMCLLQLVGYSIMLKNNFSNKRTDLAWLQLLTGGFLFVWTWIFAAHLVGLHDPGRAVSDVMGISGNYLVLVLISTLVFYSFMHPEIRENFGAEGEQGRQINPEYIERIRSIMESGKLFLNPRLTMDEFSEHAQLAPRLVSSVINRCLNQNFQEFVNRYRVEEAKRILAEPENRLLPILDVAIMAGFNSKATFNRFFHKFSGLTPSQYREKHLRSRKH